MTGQRNKHITNVNIAVILKYLKLKFNDSQDDIGKYLFIRPSADRYDKSGKIEPSTGSM